MVRPDNRSPRDQAAESAITQYLLAWRGGDGTALERLTEAVYGELRRLAAFILAGETGARSVQPTILVHELYLQLPGVRQFDWRSRAQFMNIAARIMRNILVDHARRRNAVKRGRGESAEPLEDYHLADSSGMGLNVLLVHEALDVLPGPIRGRRMWWNCVSSEA